MIQDHVLAKPEANASKEGLSQARHHGVTFSDKKLNDTKCDASWEQIDLDREELIKTVQEQRQQLERYELELSELQSEISSVEKSLHDSRVQSVKALLDELLQEESSIDVELSELELVSWDDKLTMERQKETQMTTELSLLKSSITRSEKEVTRLEITEKALVEEIEEVKRVAMKSRQDGDKEEKRELDELRSQLKDHRTSNELSHQALQSLDQDLAAALQDKIGKQAKLEGIEQELKQIDLNLDRLNLEEEPNDSL
jgi:chromosome segregation ATPase